jgi:2-enoate reductase
MQLSAGPGRVMGGRSIDEGYKPISSSENQAYFRPRTTCRELSAEEIGKLVKAFGVAAEIVHDAGMDGIEIHGHEGYLIDQFATALWNRRTDKYGGDLERRLTFAKEIVNTIKKHTGQKFPVVYRYGSKHFIKGPWKGALKTDEIELGRDLIESVEMAKILERDGYDCLHIDTGCYESAYWAHPPLYFPDGMSVDLTSTIRKEVNIPVIAVGKLGNPEVAEKTLSDGKADMIALGRDLLSDPYWPRKVFSGNEQEIRRCIGCHECMNRAETGQYLSCAVNPICGNEGIVSIIPSKRKRKIMVAGGGIAGMEAAVVSTIRGFDVRLYEATEQLGGNAVAGSVPGFKKDIGLLLEWYRYQFRKLKIDARLGTRITIDTVEEENPDIIIVATGSTPKKPNIAGAETSKGVHCTDVLLSRTEVGRHVLVIGGGVMGCETGLWLSQNGKKVTIVEMLPELATDIHRSNRAMLLDLLGEQRVALITNTKIIRIDSDEAIAVNDEFESSLLKFDTIVYALGLVPENEIYKTLVEREHEVYAIGDCIKPRKIYDAVWEANMLVNSF